MTNRRLLDYGSARLGTPRCSKFSGPSHCFYFAGESRVLLGGFQHLNIQTQIAKDPQCCWTEDL